MKVMEFLRDIALKKIKGINSLRDTAWKDTAILAGVRISVAAVMFTTLFFAFGNLRPIDLIPQLFGSTVIFAMFIGISIPAGALSSVGVPYVGLLTFPAWLVCIGDPVVKFIHAKWPELVPVQEFKFFMNPPALLVMKTEGDYQDYQAQDGYQTRAPSQSHPSPTVQMQQNNFERGRQLFNNREQKDGMELIAQFADNNPDHIEANLFMASELAKADLTGFADLIRKYAQNVVRNAPSNEEAKRILDQLNNMGQPVQIQRSSISLTKNPGEPAQTTQQVNRIGIVAYQAAYQSSSRDQKAWLDSEESALLAKSIISDASMDSGSTKTRAALIRVISSYYLRLIQPTDLANQLKIEAEIGYGIAERMASKIVEAVRPV